MSALCIMSPSENFLKDALLHYDCYHHHADCYTERYYGYQRSTGKKSETFQLNCEQQKIALLPMIDSCLPNNTLKLATERTTLDFDLR